MTFRELQAFLREAQKDARAEDPAYVGNLFKDFAKAPRYRDPRQPSLTLPEVGVASTMYTQCRAVRTYFFVFL